jgi:hypothetical protein
LWNNHFARLGVPHLQLDYETYVGHRAKSLRSLARFLGLKPVRAPLVDRLNVMRDEWTAEITARVWADLYGVPEPVRLLHVPPGTAGGPAEPPPPGVAPEPVGPAAETYSLSALGPAEADRTAG